MFNHGLQMISVVPNIKIPEKIFSIVSLLTKEIIILHSFR